VSGSLQRVSNDGCGSHFNGCTITLCKQGVNVFVGCCEMGDGIFYDPGIGPIVIFMHICFRTETLRLARFLFWFQVND